MNSLIKITIIFYILISLLNNVSAEEKVIEQAVKAPLAEKSLLLASAKYNELMVVVGERGHIFYSNDSMNWQQAEVDTRATLTDVYLYDDKTAWAVGHDAVILRTKDGAKTWQKVFSDIDEQAPLLDVIFQDELKGMAIGAYGLMYVTTDGGLSWKKKELNIMNRGSVVGDTGSNIDDYHLNAIFKAEEQRFYLLAEAGHILRSDDAGLSWYELGSPYQGSYFGGLALSLDEVLIYGLRGHIYRSTDAGESWDLIRSYTQEMLTSAKILANGNIIIAGLAGTLLVSNDHGLSFTKLNLKQRYGISSILENSNGSLTLTTDKGIQLISDSILKNSP